MKLLHIKKANDNKHKFDAVLEDGPKTYNIAFVELRAIPISQNTKMKQERVATLHDIKFEKTGLRMEC
jgi:hypothetical protein